MAATAKAVAIESTGTPGERLVNLRLMFACIAGLSVLWGSARLYQQFFAWSAGLDSSTPEFQAYWMRLFYVEGALEGIAAVSLWGWLWRTRDRNLAALGAHE